MGLSIISLGKSVSQIFLGKIEEIHMGCYMKFYRHVLGMNMKQRSIKKSIGDGARRLGELWSMLGHFRAED
jgi:hypothetical protein